ncbi:nucleotide sugar dehydrogenase [Microbacterium sp. Bi121]|uniref:nucleotide sugar dehydrogenase n=1 Tax=Microbacterium sp. Bi121 TaxID=2822348 RepID=UPI001DFCEEB5|nr:nucleotide sugar dehydrogenase [Microbacterium sp. Bi121]CAH0220343.1 UDP-N-acetyl-D-glucosamine 6-dehydrogenase [Microbacterium sp. Bi121]
MSVKVVIVGQGYVGLPVAMRAVEADYDVVGVDLDARRIDRLHAGDSYVDDVAQETLRAALASGRYLASTNYEDARDFDYAVITVPTPLKESLPDLTFIESAANSLAPHLKNGATVILESTTYPGTTEEIVVPILEQGSGLRAALDFHVGYSPERIDPGNKTWGFVETPKVVSGIDPASTEQVDLFYSSLVNRTVRVSGTKEAELTKLLENTFRHVNIALVNELAVFANELDINIWEAIDAAATKPFGFMKFTPGPGVGGHCLPVDPSYLSWQVRRRLGRNFRFVELANDVNDHMPNYVVDRAALLLNNSSVAMRGASVLLVGLAYKRNTGDIRESPSLALIDLLNARGADVSGFDIHVEPHHWPERVTRVRDLEEGLASADLVILVTDHDDIDLNLVANSAVPTLDTRNRLTGDTVDLL